MADELPALADMIADEGINPVEWDFKRLCATLRQIDEWEEQLASGKYPAELDTDTAKETLAAEIASAKEECRGWRDYALPKRKSTEMSGTLNVPVVRTQDVSDVDL